MTQAAPPPSNRGLRCKGREPRRLRGAAPDVCPERVGHETVPALVPVAARGRQGRPGMAFRTRGSRRCWCQHPRVVPAARCGKDATRPRDGAGGGDLHREQLRPQRDMDLPVHSPASTRAGAVREVQPGGTCRTGRERRHSAGSRRLRRLLPGGESVRHRRRLGHQSNRQHNMDMGRDRWCR